MTEVSNNSLLDAHYSADMKVKRPNFSVAEAPNTIPKHALFSEKEANKKIRNLNTDIYEGAKKEKSKHSFNLSLYLKIFGGIVLGILGYKGIKKLINFFRKS